jgi:endonuclease YncB( thermonuclease family)
VVNEELIREGLARVFTRYRDRAICEQWRRLEDGREQRSGDCEQRRMRSPVGVSEKQEITASTSPFLPYLPMIEQ